VGGDFRGEHKAMATAINGQHRSAVYVPTKIKTERTIITPDVARKLLEANRNNRNVIKLHFRSLCECLRRGEWVFNGETIIVADTGRILNGQHRLMACAETCIPIDTNITYGVQESTFHTIDRGRARTVGDVLGIEGEANPNVIAGGLRMFWLFCISGAIVDGGCAQAGFSPALAMTILEKNPTFRDSVPSAQSCATFPSKSLLAAMHYVFSMVSPEAASQLIETMRDGGGEKDRPFNVLREHFIHLRLNRQKPTNAVMAAKTIRAFNAELDGERLSRIPWKLGSNFPLVNGLNYDTLVDLI
jgi:hypothetical protein